MRWQRYGFIFLTFYLIFFGGGGYFEFPIVRYFHHIFMTVLFAAWLIWRLRKGRGLPPSPINLPLYGLFIIWLLTSFFSLDPRSALENLWFSVINLMTFWFIVNAFQRAQKRLVMDTLFLTTVIIVFLAGIQIFSVLLGWGIGRPSGDGWLNYLGQGIAMPWQRDMRIWLPLGVSTWVSGVVAPLITITIAWGVSTPRPIHKRLFWLLACLLGIVLLLTFSRGGLVSVLAAICCFALLRLAKHRRLQSLFTGRNIAILGGLAILIAVIGLAVMTIGSQSGHQSGDDVRLDLWRSAIQTIQDSPLVGVGTGLFGRALREHRSLEFSRDRLSTAHNFYLNSAAETGILTLLVGLWAVLIIVRVWWRRRQAAETDSMQQIRLDGMFAALLGFALHNMVDTLTITAGLTLLSVMIVYCIVEPARSRLDSPSQGNRLTAIIALVILLVYGIAFVAIIDRAQQHFENSVNLVGDPLQEAEVALSIDPSLHLYNLQIADVLGQEAFANPTDENLTKAVASYENAVALEPTWDTGWLNLGALYELQGNLDVAIEAYDKARDIQPRNQGDFNWARLMESNGKGEASEIVAAYESSIAASGYLPLSTFWDETELRQQALEDYASQLAIDLQYRIWAVHDPSRLPELVPDNPKTAAEWWIVGEDALTIENDSQKAADSFTQAIKLAPNNGNYYASRARATLKLNPESALNDLAIARFLGTRYEYPNAIEIALRTDPVQIRDLRINGLPPIVQSHNFEGVLFSGRNAAFRLLRSVRFPGPGTAAMQVWYDLAADYEAQGDLENAKRAYEAILNYAPDESRATEALARLP